MSTALRKLLSVCMLAAILALPGCRDTRAAPGTTVYVTRTGECYHRSNCRHLRKSKIEYTLEDAIGEGYRPCGTCEPPDSYKIEGER